MSLGLIGTKIGMTQVYDESGNVTPVTVLQVGPCPVLQIRTQERDGYDAVQVGYLDKARRKATRADRGHVSSQMESKRRTKNDRPLIMPKAECEPQKFIREFRLETPAEVEVGTELTVGQVLDNVKAVDVTGTSKGRGTAGVMKRHGFSGLRASHGIKKGQRQAGSTASNCSTGGSGRPKKGIRMAGRYGNSRVTARNLKVVKFDVEDNLVLVKGAVPGPNGGTIYLRPTNKKRKTQED